MRFACACVLAILIAVQKGRDWLCYSVSGHFSHLKFVCFVPIRDWYNAICPFVRFGVHTATFYTRINIVNNTRGCVAWKVWEPLLYIKKNAGKQQHNDYFLQTVYVIILCAAQNHQCCSVFVVNLLEGQRNLALFNNCTPLSGISR